MNSSEFSHFLSGLTSRFTPVLDPLYKEEDYIPIDLSELNKQLTGTDMSSAQDVSDYLEVYLRENKAGVAFGGYNEVRKLYRRSELFAGGGEEDSPRNIHLGLDLWAPAGTPVLAALDGRVHSFRDNAAFGDYGPTIILEHQMENQRFFTLYGHLSRTSLEGLSEGQEVKQGEVLAALGSASENGDYAPHLHFQVIRDLQGKKGDYPGVSSRKDLNFYLQNCPNPDILLKITRMYAGM